MLHNAIISSEEGQLQLTLVFGRFNKRLVGNQIRSLQSESDLYLNQVLYAASGGTESQQFVQILKFILLQVQAHFTVSNAAGNAAGSNTIDYLVVAGGASWWCK